MSDLYDAIQAFVDGEPVDPAALERALADPGGRAHLIDILVLRSLVKRADDAGRHVRASGDTTPGVVRRRPSRWIAAAAAAVLVATLASVGGYVVGERTSSVRPVSARGAQDATPAASDAIAAPAPSAAPAPTVVITFKPGVDWTERGGH